MADYTDVPPKDARRLDPTAEWYPKGSLPEDRQKKEVWLSKGLDEGSLSEVVGQSIGAGSMCWLPGTGGLEFDSTRASLIVTG